VSIFDAGAAMQIAASATAQMSEVALKAVISGVPEDGIDPTGVVPANLARFLARLRLLEGVPFNYLVPDAAMLPLETIRFFYVDRNWLDAIVQGALSVGTVNSADREKLTALYPIVRREVDVAERLVRMKDADAPAVDAAGRPIGVAGPMTGFLMRSKIVSGWPALHVRAYAKDAGAEHDDDTIPDDDVSPDRVRLLRMERLAPAVLLVLFDGVPAVVHIEEPRSGIQFGVRVKTGTSGTATAALPLRDVTKPNDGFLQTGAGNDRTIPVPFRKGAPGVINIKELSDTLTSTTATKINTNSPPGQQPGIDSAEFAMEMLRFPIRQVFGDTSVTVQHDQFVATLNVAAMAQQFALIAQVLGQ
jgi:hypothetical protein